MTQAKEQAREVIDQMPETASWDEIMYGIYVRAKVAEGLKDADAGNVVSQEEIEKQFPE
jgi:predicted transcriptional regulator